MIRIIGCGNILRRDDGVGVYAVEELNKTTLPVYVELVDAGTSALDMLSFLEGAEKAVIVDGVLPRSNPGTIYRAEIDEAEVCEEAEYFSMHDFSWEQGLAACRNILGNKFCKSNNMAT